MPVSKCSVSRKTFPISQRLTSHGAAVSVGNLFLARVSGDWREGDALVKMLYQHPVTCDQGQRLSRRPSPSDLTHLVMLIDTAGSVSVLCRETVCCGWWCVFDCDLWPQIMSEKGQKQKGSSESCHHCKPKTCGEWRTERRRTNNNLTQTDRQRYR